MVAWQSSPGGSVKFWSSGNNSIFIDPEGTVDDFTDEAVLYADPNLAGIATDHPTHRRAAVLAQRLNTGTNNDDAEAWMNSSAGAKVKVCTNGDVEITLGQ